MRVFNILIKLIALAMHFTLCVMALTAITGPNKQKFFQSCALPNPYFCATVLICGKNSLAIFVSSEGISSRLYYIVIHLLYFWLTHARKNPVNCNASSTLYDMMLSSVVFILTFCKNPLTEAAMHYQRIKREKEARKYCSHTCPSCVTRRRLRKRSAISVLKPVSNLDSSDSYPSITNSFIWENGSQLETVDQETQTLVCFESKFCQYPNKDSLHFLRGGIPVQLMGRSNTDSMIKVQSGLMSDASAFLEGKNGDGDTKTPYKSIGGTIFENNSVLACTDSGHSELKHRQTIYKPHANRNLPSKSPPRIASRNVDSGIVNIEDLIGDNAELSMVPTKDIVVPVEVPKSLVSALQSIADSSHVHSVKTGFQSNINSSALNKFAKSPFEGEREVVIHKNNNFREF